MKNRARAQRLHYKVALNEVIYLMNYERWDEVYRHMRWFWGRVRRAKFNTVKYAKNR